MSKMTIIEGNSNDKDNTRVYMVKGETGASIGTITKTATQGLVDTYTITMDNGATHTFTVTNGKSINSITKTATQGLVDTYTITFNDGTTTTYEVTNGKDGTPGTPIAKVTLSTSWSQSGECQANVYMPSGYTKANTVILNYAYINPQDNTKLTFSPNNSKFEFIITDVPALDTAFITASGVWTGQTADRPSGTQNYAIFIQQYNS